ncbi:MAG: helix-turn-helix domain-containing protein [Methanobrevibacter thaueri]|jgi:DNA-binding XRE family transcriptional regulator|uniref:helix-turn-helix transcriptional regulator n=1 Tax=Methanobrevibacter thaueri TaxID=190975 RepID=UPI0026EDE8E9|nr:helix-turn-helix domain-containing protein [Methanobrevibacter thaueri]MBE6494987.1 helix-turn-helix domain-containing protein [Methanobrevibacter thaueri]
MMNNIRQLREQLDISQEQLASLADISVEELDDIENNRTIPSLITANNIKNALNEDFIANVFIFDD